jgi:hypothetical protein
MQLTDKFRLRDKHGAELNRQAWVVNAIFNYVNEAQRHMLRWDRWLSYVDLARLTAGPARKLDLHAHTVQRVCRQHVESRKLQRKPWLRWRGRKSSGWVAFNTGHVSFDGEDFTFRGGDRARSPRLSGGSAQRRQGPRARDLEKTVRLGFAALARCIKVIPSATKLPPEFQAGIDANVAARYLVDVDDTAAPASHMRGCVCGTFRKDLVLGVSIKTPVAAGTSISRSKLPRRTVLQSPE